MHKHNSTICSVQNKCLIIIINIIIIIIIIIILLLMDYSKIMSDIFSIRMSDGNMISDRELVAIFNLL